MMPPDLGMILQRQVQDRWMTTEARQYTPAKIEAVIRGAMSGNLISQWEMFDLMEGTWGRLNKNLNELKDAVVDLDWGVQPYAARGTKPTAEAERRAEIVDEMLWNFDPNVAADENDFQDTIRDMLDARGKGIVALEVDWQPAETSAGMVIAPRATTWIHPRNYGYPPTETGADRLKLNLREVLAYGNQDRAAGIEQLIAAGLLQADGNGFADFPPDKFLIGICKTKSGHPLGGAMLRLLGFWWAATNFTAEWFLNFAQIFGMPVRWASYDPAMTPEDKKVLAAMLANMGSAAWAMFPAGTALELKEASKSAGDNVHKVLLEFANQQCDTIILRQTLTTEVGSSGGNRALGEVHEGVLAGVKLGVANWAAKNLNRQFIRSICRLNFGDTRECPYLSPSLRKETNEKEAAERDKTLLDAGAELPATWFYERHNVPMPAAGEPTIKRPSGLPQGADGSTMDPVQAKDATELLTENVLQELAGVKATWLSGVKPAFEALVVKALDGSVSDEDFLAAVVQAQRQMPELFEKLDRKALQSALERATGAAVINGAVKGMAARLRRKGAR